MSAVAVISMISGFLVGISPTLEFVASTGRNIDGRGLENAQCLAVNPTHEEFLVADALNDRIVIFDTLGAVVHAFPLGDGRHNPFGIAVNAQGEILVGAMDLPELWLFDYGGAYLGSIALPDSVLPGRLIFSDNGEIIVIDRAGRGFLRIDSDGNVLGSIVSVEADCKPSGVFVDRAGNMAMVSYGGNVITGFGSDGKAAYTKGEHGRRPEDFSHPTAALVDSLGWLWVIDSFRHHIKRFNAEGAFVDIIGQRGVNSGEFYFPADFKLSPSGRLAILDKGAGRLQIFRIRYAKD